MQQLKSLAHEYLMTISYSLRDIIIIDTFMTRNINCDTLVLVILLFFIALELPFLFVSIFQAAVFSINFFWSNNINDFPSIHLIFPMNSNTIHYVHGIIQERDNI